MNFFQQIRQFISRSAPMPTLMTGGRNMAPPTYQLPPTTAHALRFTEHVTPQEDSPLAKGLGVDTTLNRRRRRPPHRREPIHHMGKTFGRHRGGF